MERKYARQLLDEIMQQAVGQSAEGEVQEIVLCRTAAEECDVLLDDSVKSKWPPNLSRSLLKKIKELKENLGKLELLYTLEKNGKFDPNAKDFLTEIVQIAKKMRRDRLYQRELWLLQEQERLKKLAEDFKEWKEDLDIKLKQSLEQLENFFVTYKAETDVWQARLSYLQKQLADLERRIAAIDEEIAKLNEQVQEIALQIEQNNEQIRQHEASIKVIEQEESGGLGEKGEILKQMIFGYLQKKSVQLTVAKIKEVEDSIARFVNDSKESIIYDSPENLCARCEEFCMNHIKQNLSAEQGDQLDLEELREQWRQDVQKIEKITGVLKELAKKKKELMDEIKRTKEKNPILENKLKRVEEEIVKNKAAKADIVNDKNSIEQQIKKAETKTITPKNELSEYADTDLRPKIIFGS